MEAGFAEAREIGLSEVQLPESGWPLLSAIHQHLFQDIYAWAGQLRTEDMTKMSMEDILSGSLPQGTFTAHSRLPEALDLFFAELDIPSLTQAADDEFVKLFSSAYETLNRHHPFREGNGRTQRRYWDVALHDSGRSIDWESGQTQIHAVSRATDRGNFEPLRRLVRVMMRPS